MPEHDDKIARLARFITGSFTCPECDTTMSLEQAAYGHDCEIGD